MRLESALSSHVTCSHHSPLVPPAPQRPFREAWLGQSAPLNHQPWLLYRAEHLEPSDSRSTVLNDAPVMVHRLSCAVLSILKRERE